MNIFLIIPLIIFIFILFLKEKMQKIIIPFILYLFMGLRSIHTGTDLTNYLNFFKLASGRSFSDYTTVIHSLDSNIEYGFLFINKILSFICGQNERMYILITSASLIFFLKKFIDKNSKDVGYSYLIYIFLGFYLMSMNILRQVLAAEILFFSYEYIQNRNFKRFILIYLLAISIHTTAIIWIVVYFIYPLKLNIKYYTIVLIILLTNLYFSKKIVYILINLLPKYKNRYENLLSNGTGSKLLILYLGILFFIILCKKYNSIHLKLYNHLLCITVIFQSLALSFGMLSRLVLYFSYSLIILIPNLIDKQINSEHIIEKISLFLIFYVGYFYLIYLGDIL